MADKEQRIYTVPLRGAYKSPRVYRARKAVKYLRDYLEKHLKSEVAIGPGLNQKIWARGIKKPPTKVKVTVKKEDDKYRAELFGYVPKPKPEKKKKKKSIKDVAKEKVTGRAKKQDSKKEKTKEMPSKAEKSIKEEKQAGGEKPEKAKPVKEDKKETKKPEAKEEKKGEKNGLQG